MRILTNHIGYETTASKHAVVLGQAGDNVLLFSVKKYETGEQVFSGIPQKIGAVHKWKDWCFWTVDFDPVVEEGVYNIECSSDQETVRSFPFVIQDNLLERNTLSDLLYYFQGQRCSGLFDKADTNLAFADPKEGIVDAHGGWYDATGDYGKHLSHLCFATFFNPQQIPLVVWSLFKTYAALDKRNDPNFRQYKRRLLDEALFGADYLARVKNPSGSFYISVAAQGVEKKPADRRIMPAMLSFALADEDTKDAYTPRKAIDGGAIYEASYRAGAGVSIAALAMASTHKISGDFDTKNYLKAAEDTFAFLEKHNLHLTNDGKENIIDDYCALVAATELFKASQDERYRSAADERAKSLMGRLIARDTFKNYWRADDDDRPFFHPSDAGLPVVSLLYYLDIADDEIKSQVLETVRRSLNFEIEVTEAVANPFGYSRQLVQNKMRVRRTSFFFPHDTETAPWWQGENARLASMATAARMAVKYFEQDKSFCDKLQAFAWNQLNWV